MIKLVIFDLDGTLVDAFAAVVDSFNFALESVGAQRRSALEIERCVGHGERHLIESLIPVGQVDAALTVYRKHHKGALKDNVKFLPDVAAFLETLKAEGYQMAIASNRPSYFTRIILDELQIKGYFKQVLCADQVFFPKPAPDILNTLISAHEVERDEVLFVGDTATDMETGQRAGVRTLGITTGPHTVEDLIPFAPYKIVSNINEVKEVLNDLYSI
ncbi:HAD family hydrolase [Candidatus Omnitrophota bacterium]